MTMKYYNKNKVKRKGMTKDPHSRRFRNHLSPTPYHQQTAPTLYNSNNNNNFFFIRENEMHSTSTRAQKLQSTKSSHVYETPRKLQRGQGEGKTVVKDVAGDFDKVQGAGRAASRAVKGAAGEVSEGAGSRGGLPEGSMVDWSSWGRVWMDDTGKQGREAAGSQGQNAAANKGQGGLAPTNDDPLDDEAADTENGREGTAKKNDLPAAGEDNRKKATPGGVAVEGGRGKEVKDNMEEVDEEEDKGGKRNEVDARDEDADDNGDEEDGSGSRGSGRVSNFGVVGGTGGFQAGSAPGGSKTGAADGTAGGGTSTGDVLDEFDAERPTDPYIIEEEKSGKPHTRSPSYKPPTSEPTEDTEFPDTGEPTNPVQSAPTSPSAAAGGTTCQLCSDGKTATHMARTLIGSPVSCQDIANTLAKADAAICDGEKDKIPVDIEAYCGCPGKSHTPSCSFCPDGTENIWHNISIPTLQDWTCKDVEDYADYITNSAACAEMTAISTACCGTWEQYWANGDDDAV